MLSSVSQQTSCSVEKGQYHNDSLYQQSWGAAFPSVTHLRKANISETLQQMSPVSYSIIHPEVLNLGTDLLYLNTNFAINRQDKDRIFKAFGSALHKCKKKKQSCINLLLRLAYIDVLHLGHGNFLICLVFVQHDCCAPGPNRKLTFKKKEKKKITLYIKSIQI